MAFVHCIIECTAPEALDHGIPFLFDYVIGSPISAPMFMFAMGIGICYSRKQGAKELAKRALRMYLIGLLLNVCRFLIPYLDFFLIRRTVDALNAAGDASPQEYLNKVTEDIAPFVGDADPFDDLTMLCLTYNGNYD